MDRAATSLPSSAPSTAASSPKRLNVFERYLSLWVGLCMVVGVVLGLVPMLKFSVRGVEIRVHGVRQDANLRRLSSPLTAFFRRAGAISGSGATTTAQRPNPIRWRIGGKPA